ncbi:MAG: hypothetical protein ABF649_16225 [Bacillus sp. (in: firmicutes)]
MWHAKDKQYSKAVSYFNEAFINYEEDFYYKKEFDVVIDSYLQSGNKKKAKEILLFLLKRKNFDKKFKKLEKNYHELLN